MSPQRGLSYTAQYLVCNFDLDLLALFSEVSNWEKFQVRKAHSVESVTDAKKGVCPDRSSS